MHAYLLPIKEHIQTDRSITTALKSVLELVGARIWITSSCAMKAVYRLHSEVFLVDICQPLGAATVWPFYRDGAAYFGLAGFFREVVAVCVGHHDLRGGDHRVQRIILPHTDDEAAALSLTHRIGMRAAARAGSPGSATVSAVFPTRARLKAVYDDRVVQGYAVACDTSVQGQHQSNRRCDPAGHF
jgi:hypothetical protein